MSTVANIHNDLAKNGVIRRRKVTLFITPDATGAGYWSPTGGDSAAVAIPKGGCVHKVTIEPENGTDTLQVSATGTSGANFCLHDGTLNYSVIKPYASYSSFSAFSARVWKGTGWTRYGSDGAPVCATADVVGTALRFGICTSAGAIVTAGSPNIKGLPSKLRLTLWVDLPDPVVA